MEQPINDEFINMELYSIYKSISELFGEKGWDVIWRSGEIMFDELEKELEFPSKEPLAVMQVIADYLVSVGYIKKLVFRMVGENIMEYDLYGPAYIRPAILKLKKENCVLGHWSTVIMFAALRKLCGVKAETDAAHPEIVSDTLSRERWVLSKI